MKLRVTKSMSHRTTERSIRKTLLAKTFIASKASFLFCIEEARVVPCKYNLEKNVFFQSHNFSNNH